MITTGSRTGPMVGRCRCWRDISQIGRGDRWWIGLACPEDISLLGFDDFYWATLLRPRLTVVRQPAREIGMVAARLLIDHIEGRPSVPSPALLETQLIVRDSCSPPKKA